MIELVGCILLSIICITFIVMLIDELRTNHKMRKWYKSIIGNDINVGSKRNIKK